MKWNVYDNELSKYLSFLANMYESGLSYASINTARSALSAVFPDIDNCKIGEHRLITQFMKGISKLRPPTPKYSLTWDSSKMLDVLKSLDSETIPLRELTLKVLALLALVTAQRAQVFSQIQIHDILWGDPIQIKIPSILKTTTIKNPNPILIIPSFENKSLCPIFNLKMYVEKTKILRGESANLFISFVSPYKPVTSQTISKWLCKTLDMAGVDSSIYTGHSFRHAATSKASSRKVNVDAIFQRVGWSNRSNVFAKHYNKKIDDRTTFANSLLSN